MLFRFPPKLGSKFALHKYLEADLFMWMRDLSVGLLKMNFVENFESFRVDNLLIKNGEEVAIANQFKSKANNLIPSSRIIVRQQATGAIGNTGNGLITDGLTAWNSNLVYLYNQGPEDTIVSVIFFK